jgi:hypothetical protein
MSSGSSRREENHLWIMGFVLRISSPANREVSSGWPDSIQTEADA